MTRGQALAAFRRDRERFRRWLAAWGAPTAARALRARLRIVDRRCPEAGARGCAARDLAVAYPDAGEVHLVARALALPSANVVAILRHELGHLADPTPGAPGAEQRADDLAEAACGAKIRYDSRMIQTISSGVGTTYPRPRRLHR